ncbi:TAXI family TRAP transporter solute-binding subunit [Rhodococcus sp. MSC1_016]|uniref:TAXI family TRAP transporter solute-binding subunit n=1 Tax=Rhodococcus sp. MSC1_016 TaxID=2909266 RepID=UPI00202FB021|nr:TAXI family TRAP transporter solute-binding subunit [Rhodococcus sp. MSC1_016]
MITYRPEEPKIQRSLTLHMQGDWGAANLHRVCGWISQELTDRSGHGTRVAIWNGRGFADGVRAVGRGEVDIAMTTPAAFASAALDGRGIYRDEYFPQLRALGVVPQRDRLVVAIHRSVGVTTFAELREQSPRLKAATALDDNVNHVGLAARALLREAGVDIPGWGGEFLEDERPQDAFAHVLSGEANAIVQEAVMLPQWQQFGADFNFLEVEPDVLSALETNFGWPAATVGDGYFPGQSSFRTLDFSDFLMLTTTDLADDVAYAVAWILGETRHIIEEQYRHLPPEGSPITYPLDPSAIGRAPIPLHPGAARYYHALPTS